MTPGQPALARRWLALPRRVSRSVFARNVLETYATRIVLIVVGLATSVAVTRALGPGGRGVFAVAVTVTVIGIQFGNLGLHASNTYYISKDPSLLPRIIGNLLLVSLGLGAAGALCAGLIFLSAPSIAPVQGIALALALTAVPFGLGAMLLQNLLIALHKVRAANISDLLSKGGILVLVAILLVGRWMTPVAVLAVTLAGYIAAFCYTLCAALKSTGIRPMPSLTLLRGHLGYGLRAYAAAFSAYLVLRSDMFLVEWFRGFRQAGEYSVAVNIADLIYLLPTVLGSLIFPKLAATDDAKSRRSVAFRATRMVALTVGGFGLAAALLARPVVLLLYGKPYLPAAPAVAWIMPGIVALSVNCVLMNLFASEGMPPITVISPACAAALNIGLNLWLIPEYGIAGAAIASTIAYGMMLAASILYLSVSGKRVAA